MAAPSRIAIVHADDVASAIADGGQLLRVDAGALAELAPSLALVIARGDASDLAFIRQAVGPRIPVLALVSAELASEALAAGATDVIDPAAPPALVRARAASLRAGFEADVLGSRLAGLYEGLARIEAALGSQPDADAIAEALAIARDVLGFEHGALVSNVESIGRATVVASTDQGEREPAVLALWDAAELREAAVSLAPQTIPDVQSHALTAAVASKLRDEPLRSVALAPMGWDGRLLGVIVLSSSEEGRCCEGPELTFLSLLAMTAAAYLRDAPIAAVLREDTSRISRAKYEADRRLRTVDSLKEHFEAAADGVFVVADDGRLLFVNGVAEAITGFASDALIGVPLADLILDSEQEVLSRALDSVLEGDNLEAFDLHLSTTSGQPVCVSVTTSTVLARSGSAIFSFREVTQERALEIELRKTKEFLEKMIDSTVDGIVAADLEGTIILFNPGAERIFGYTASEVIGRAPVHSLYPEGVPQQIMRMLRADTHGGVGRLEQTRREIVTRNGELVPVNMTASIIYEDDVEVATVGIFSDLRERIRIEQRLLKAQEKLELSEKRALVAQLAGTAAHELNQPLTSIMGYAQLVARQLAGDAAGSRAVEIILREAERMAEIVRKIGRITRFETKEYVGGTSIIDLDKSADAPGLVAGRPVQPAVDEDTQPQPKASPDVVDSKKTLKIPLPVPDDDNRGGAAP